jgi:glycosyltransferase involved in cell wall biosynthesis
MPTPSKELPRIAVIIPCHNQSKYVEQALVSVAEQDYPNKTIYISDEASTDDSFNKIVSLVTDIQTYANGTISGKIKNTNIVVFQQTKADGPSPARNRIINESWDYNDLFAMLDADDYYLPGKLSKSVNIIQKDFDNIGLVYTDAIIYHQEKDVSIVEYREPYSKNRLYQECIVSNTPVVNKKALADVGLYDETMRTAEDWDLWLRISSKYVLVHIPEALHVYRVTGQNASDIVSKDIWNQNWQKIRERIYGSSY